MSDRLRKFITPGNAVVATLMLVLIMSGFLLVQSFWTTTNAKESSAASFSTLDLTARHWYARLGFSDGDAQGFDTSARGVLAIDHFPILLNAVFKVPPGKKINDFALMMIVDLDARAVSQNLMLSLSQIGDNWAVYMNGVVIQNEIYLDGNAAIRRHRSVQNALIPIPPGVLRAGANTIVFNIKGMEPTNPIFSGWQVGLSSSNGYLLGRADALIQARTYQDAVSCLQMGVYLFFSLLQLFLFFRQREIYSFYFSIFLFSCAVYSFSYSNVAFGIIPDTVIIQRMMFGANFIWPGLVGLTIWSYLYPRRAFEPWLGLIAGISLAFTLAIWVAPFEWHETLLAIFLLVTVASAVYIQYTLIRAVREKVRDAKTIFVSSCIIFVMIVWTVLDLFIFRTGVDVIGWAPFFLAVAFALVFIDRLWRTAIDLTESNRVISMMRDHMESQVILRTQELSQANEDLIGKLEEINALQDNLREMAMRDALTGLYNRRYLVESLEREFALVERKHASSLVMIDIDHFKTLNDTYGHKAGDQVLKDLSAFMMAYFRQSDLIFRFGGEEFLAILPDAHLVDALWRSEEFCKVVEKMVIHFEGHCLKITLSAGVAEMHLSDDSPERALKRADSGLYEAKNKGRNRVEAVDG